MDVSFEDIAILEREGSIRIQRTRDFRIDETKRIEHIFDGARQIRLDAHEKRIEKEQR